jgi:hypothetical protein
MATKSTSGGRTRQSTQARKPWEKDGPSPNPRGRPPKQPRPIHNRQLRDDFFEISQLEVTIPVQGEPRKMTLMQAIIFKEFEQGLNGHAISRRSLMKWYRTLVTEEEDWGVRFYKAMKQQEAAELERKKKAEGLTPEEEEHLKYLNSDAFKLKD